MIPSILRSPLAKWIHALGKLGRGPTEDANGGDGEDYVLASRETRRADRVVYRGITNIESPPLLVREDQGDWIYDLEIFLTSAGCSEPEHRLKDSHKTYCPEKKSKSNERS